MPLRLEIVSPERMVYNDDVDMVIVPGRNGQLGILPHHTPLISSLGVGELRIKKSGSEEAMLIRGGAGGGEGGGGAEAGRVGDRADEGSGGHRPRAGCAADGADARADRHPATLAG